jgi:hypothetical protein
VVVLVDPRVHGAQVEDLVKNLVTQTGSDPGREGNPGWGREPKEPRGLAVGLAALHTV